MAETLKEGDFVTLDYVGKVKATGQIFDLTKEEVAKKEGIYDPNLKYGSVPVVVGGEHVLRGLDAELKKLSVGDNKTVTVVAKDAFGERDPNLVKLIPRSEFKKQNMRPIPGMPVEIQGTRGVIMTVSGGRVKVDFNHPLAGKELEYDLEIHKKIGDKVEQIKSLFELHLAKVDTSGVKIEIKDDTAEITTPEDQKTRRYINLTEDIVAKDIIKYISNLKQVKFIDVFTKEASNS